MREILHIFMKDARQLRWELAVSLALLAAFAYLDSGRSPIWTAATAGFNRMAATIPFLLCLVWWMLIALVVHHEAIPGDRQYWLTRPVSRTRLCAAKLLFVFAFINAPLFLADCAILARAGFNPMDHLAGLLCRELLVTALMLLPAAALAVVTKDLAQMALAAVAFVLAAALFIALVMESPARSGPTGLGWIHEVVPAVVLLGVAAIMLYLQYARRATALASAVFVCGVGSAMLAIAFLPFGTAFAIQTRLTRTALDTNLIRISFLPVQEPKPAVVKPLSREVSIAIPLRITALPDDVVLKPDKIVITVEGLASCSPLRASIVHGKGRLSETVYLSRALYETVKEQPLRIHNSFFFTLLEKRQTTRQPALRVYVAVPGVGVCRSEDRGLSLMVPCKQTGRRPTRLVVELLRRGSDELFVPAEVFNSWSYSPLPSGFGISPLDMPVVAHFRNPPGFSDGLAQYDLRYTTYEPVAHLQREFVIDNIRLKDYVASDLTL